MDKLENVIEMNLINKTKKKIANTFLKIAKQKKIEYISIQEICESIPIARTTFYYYYKNTRELIDEIQNSYLNYMYKISIPLYDNIEDESCYLLYAEDIFNRIKENLEVPKLFLIDQPDDLFLKKCEKVMERHFIKSRVEEKDKIELLSIITIATFRYILKKSDNFSMREFNSQIRNIHRMIRDF